MKIDKENLFQTFSLELEKCADEHNDCIGCPYKASCLQLWDFVSNAIAMMTLKSDDVRKCLQVFHGLWNANGSLSVGASTLCS